MTAVLAAFLSGTLAALVVLAAHAGLSVLALTIALVVVLVAIGWAVLLDLPNPRGTAAVVALTGWAGVGATLVVRQTDRSLGVFSGLIALAVLLAFGHELLRRGHRERLVESVTGTLAGQVVAVLGAGWVLLPTTSLAEAGVMITAVALGTTRVIGAFPWRGFLVGWAPFVLGTAAGAAAAAVLGHGGLATGMLAGTVAGTVAGMDRLLVAQRAARSPLGMLCGAAAPATATGTMAFAVAILVAG